jgi:hypothetical protein
MEADPIAIRGSRLSLTREKYRDTDDADRPIVIELLTVTEVSDGDLVHDTVDFDPDDVDAAFEELEARYLAGEGAAYAHTWSVICGAVAAANRHEFPGLTPDWASVDHRRAVAFAPGDMTAYVEALWDTTPRTATYVEAVHRLSAAGAVVTQVASGTSQQGFEAEWRMIGLSTVDGDLINRIELFDAADLGAALARLDELEGHVPQLDNAATRAWSRVADAFNRRDFDGLIALTTADARADDRRKGLQSVLEGSASQKNVYQVFELTPTSWRMEVEPLAVRGSRLSLSRGCLRDFADPERPITLELLNVVEVDDSGLIQDTVSFDPDDLDAAFAELDSRYLAGEAAAHARTWSVISGAIAATNRHEVFSTTPDWVNVNHHRATSFEPGELNAYIRSSWEDMPGGRTYIEAVHRLSNLGAVITHRAEGATTEGFEAEWRGIDLMTVDGDLISRSEMFEEADLDAALARFDELGAQRLS